METRPHSLFGSFFRLTVGSAVSLLGVSGPGHLDGALLVIRFLGNRAGRVERQLVDQATGIEERNEDEATRRFVAAAGFDAQLDFTAPRGHLDHHAALHATGLGIVRVHEDDGVREGFVQLGNAARHGTGMPVLKNPTGGQPEVELLVR